MRIHTETQCIYCAEPATEREHVPPRFALEKPFPANLQTLPVCSECNRGFALDEEYFLILLSQIGTSDALSAKTNEGGSVDRALTYSSRLNERITDSLSVSEDGRVMISPEPSRVSRVIEKIALGLFALKYQQVPSLSDVEEATMYPYNIEERRPQSVFVSTFTQRFRPKPWTIVQPGVFSYIFVRALDSQARLCCIMDFHHNAWGVAYVPVPRSFGVRRRQQPPNDDRQLELQFNLDK